MGPMRAETSSPPTSPRERPKRSGIAFALLALPAIGACDGGPGSEPETPAALVIRSGDGQTADARTAVPNHPTVQVTGGSGAGVGGVTVSFAVAGGGGSVASATAVTGSDGVASSGPWTLGDPGPQQLRASVSGLQPVVFGATALDVPTELVVHSGDGQQATGGTAVPDPVRVRVTGVTGAGLEGVTVGFQVTGGGGSVESATATTDGDGLASPGAWTLGAPGPQELRASVAGLDPVFVRATALGVPAALAVVAGAGQEVAVGTAVPIPPAVLVTDSAGAPLPGVPVAFLAGGGATITGAEATTDTLGRAAVGSWTLGTTAGVYRLRADVDFDGVQGNPAFIEARAHPGPAAEVVIVEGDGQVAEAKLPVPVSPRIQARDAHGNGVGGLAVSFRGGGGSVAVPSRAETDADGQAVASRWILGPKEGLEYRLTVEVADGDRTVGRVRFTATATPLRLRHRRRAHRLVGALQGPARSLREGRGVLGGGHRGQPRLEHDQEGLSGVVPRAGRDRVRGSRRPDRRRPAHLRRRAGDRRAGRHSRGRGSVPDPGGGRLPVVGIMFFDVEDLDEMEQVEDGRHLDGTILHEMAHVLGFGSLWEYLGLLEDPVDPDNPTGTEDPHFVGDSAIRAFFEVGGDGYAGEPVPAENLGGAGVVNGHWREFVFQTELMSPFIDGGVANPLSIVTLASLQDLGYEEVDLGVADEFELPSASPDHAGDHGRRWIVDGDVLRIPLAVVDRDGRVVRWVMPGGGDGAGSAAPSSRPERPDGYHRHSVGPRVPVAAVYDHPERGGLPAPARVDAIREPEQGPRGVVDPVRAQLRLEGGPATRSGVDDRVHLQAGVVPILVHASVHGLRVDAKISRDHRLEQEPEP